MTSEEGGHRRLRVLVAAVAIEDGTIARPKVGDIGVFPLRFADPVTGDGADPSVVTVRATAEPAGSPVWQSASPAVAPRWEWTVLLRGAGWTATWHTPRPVIGDVEVTGHLIGNLGYCTDGQVRGRITGVRVVADRYRGRFGVPSSWEILPGGRTYRHVTEAPGGFGDELAAFDHTRTDIVEGHREIGVLVDLDLDDVPEPAVRPSLIPESVSAHGEDLWVGDTVLPLVLRLAADRTVTEYLLPGPVTTDPAPRARRRVRATPSGCWVFGPDGLYRCENTGAVERVDEVSLSGGVVLGETFLGDASGGCDTSELVICRPQGRPLRITAPYGQVESLLTVDNAFHVLFRERDRGTGEVGACRIVRIDRAGVMTVGPAPGRWWGSAVPDRAAAADHRRGGGALCGSGIADCGGDHFAGVGVRWWSGR